MTDAVYASLRSALSALDFAGVLAYPEIKVEDRTTRFAIISEIKNKYLGRAAAADGSASQGCEDEIRIRLYFTADDGHLDAFTDSNEVLEALCQSDTLNITNAYMSELKRSKLLNRFYRDITLVLNYTVKEAEE